MRNPFLRPKVPYLPRPRRQLPVQTRRRVRPRRVRWSAKSRGQTSPPTLPPPPRPRPPTSPRTPLRTRYSNSTWPTISTVSGCLFSLVREFPLNIGVLFNQHLTVFNASQLGTCEIDALLSFHYQTYHRRLTTTSAYDWFILCCPLNRPCRSSEPPFQLTATAKIRESWLNQ